MRHFRSGRKSPYRLMGPTLAVAGFEVLTMLIVSHTESIIAKTVRDDSIDLLITGVICTYY